MRLKRNLWIPWEEVAHEIGIPEDRIVFTGFTEKSTYFKDKDFVWHLDDDWAENRRILNTSKYQIKAISAFGSPNWKGKCERILKKAKENI